MDLPFTPQGIVRCRDLVQAVRGVRIATNVFYKNFGPLLLAKVPVLNLDVRRIKYEISISEISGTNPVAVQLATIDPLSNVTFEMVTLDAAATLIIERTWEKDADAVCLGVIAAQSTAVVLGGSASISVRETFLTPLPADEPVV